MATTTRPMPAQPRARTSVPSDHFFDAVLRGSRWLPVGSTRSRGLGLARLHMIVFSGARLIPKEFVGAGPLLARSSTEGPGNEVTVTSRPGFTGPVISLQGSVRLTVARGGKAGG